MVVGEQFKNIFNSEPQVIVQSPGRVNLIGEHTDYTGGWVMPVAIDLNILLAISISKQDYSSFYALDLNETYEYNGDGLHETQKGKWNSYLIGVIEELKELGYSIPCVELCFMGNIPQGAGLSSSAALENAMVFALNNLLNLNLSKMDMIHIAQKAEQNYAGVQCGIMDQFASMFSKEGYLNMLNCANMEFEHLGFELAADVKLLLIDSKVKHQLNSSDYNIRQEECSEVLDIAKTVYAELTNLGGLSEAQFEVLYAQCNKPLNQRLKHVFRENQRVLRFKEALSNEQFQIMGRLIYESHLSLKNDYEVTCRETDFLVDSAMKIEGVLGARQVGGGFGGCVLLLFKGKNINKVIDGTYLKEYESRFGLKARNIPFIVKGGTKEISND